MTSKSALSQHFTRRTTHLWHRHLTIILLTCWLAIASAAHSQTVAIKAGRLLDPEIGKVSASQIILVANGRITKVGSGIEIPQGSKVIDLSNSTVLPGLFDCHTHMCVNTSQQSQDRGDLFYYTLLEPDSFRALQGAASAKEMLEAGFTTIRDVGNSGNYIDVSLRRAIDQGLIPGPHILAAGRIITPYGGQFHLQPDKKGLGEPEYLYADTHDEIVKAVRENVHFGADWIKIVVDDQRYIYSSEDIRVFVQEAARAGIKVCAHAISDKGVRNAIEGGVASIEHGFEMSEDTLKLAKEKDVVLVSTDFPVRHLVAYFNNEQQARSMHGGMIARLKRAYKVGTTIAFGTDAVAKVPGDTRGQQAISWIDSFVEAGVPAAEILKALIPNAASLLGLEKQRGAIKPGFAADIVAVPGNPLEDIQVLKKVSFVMKGGKVYKGGAK
jgi:imidazolonepropionase-like amidohydrolase